MSNTATGPRTDAGKERSSLNAIQHGLCSERPVVPGEDSAEWDHFQAEIVAELRPGSFTERELAERIALQMWRQRRAGRYESSADTEDKLDRVIRYERHVTRQLKEARKMLLEMQAERRAREALRPLAPAPVEKQAPARPEVAETGSTMKPTVKPFGNSDGAARSFRSFPGAAPVATLNGCENRGDGARPAPTGAGIESVR